MPTYCVRKLELRVPRCFPGHSWKLRCGFEEQPSAVQMFALANSQPPSRGQAIHYRWALSHLHQCWNMSFLHEMHVQGELLWNNNVVTTNIQSITLIFSAFFFFTFQISACLLPTVLLNLAHLEMTPSSLSHLTVGTAQHNSPNSCDVLLLPPSSLTGRGKIIFCRAVAKMRYVLTSLSPGWSSGWVWWESISWAVCSSQAWLPISQSPCWTAGKVGFWMWNSSDLCHTFWALQRPSLLF